MNLWYDKIFMSSLLYVKIQVGTYFFFDQTQVDEIIALWSQLESNHF